ncbi:MAG: hypothetical protein LR011_00680 [Verrucomicrobia bacterium]|nr:hypothetical protein [Verrucomicrobiota bacterium]
MPDIWHVVDVPGAWENSNIPEFRQFDGFAWYRAYIPIPSHWAGKRLFFSAGQIDDMDEVFFNGEKIGAYGSMPPLISDPASSIRRPYVIEPDLVQPGNWNLVAIRIYDKGGAGGITKGPVQIFSGHDAIDLAGKWFISRGDLPQLAHWDSIGDNIQRLQELNNYFNRTGRPASMDNYPLVGADKEGPRSAIQQAALLYKDNQNVHSNTEGKGDPLSPEAAIQQFQIQPGLGIDVALHEPECQQLSMWNLMKWAECGSPSIFSIRNRLVLSSLHGTIICGQFMIRILHPLPSTHQSSPASVDVTK